MKLNKIQSELIKKIGGFESANIEYKETIPSNSEKYVKTIIAFANGNGGKVVFGVEDKSLKVIGIDRENIFKYADAITNAIYDSCEPKIMPDVSIQEIDGKLLIVAEVCSGMQKPYYYKSFGIADGTFIRVSGTTRKAPQYIIQELLLKGSNRSFDQIELDRAISVKEITKFCDNIYKFILERDEQKKDTIRRLTRNQLISWKIIKEKGKKYYPTNAFFLLSGNNEVFTEATIQCAVFKGKNRSGIMLSKRELKGPLYSQIDEAYNFVIQHIDVSSKIDGLYRKDKYELPPFAIREVIANAVCHRSYLAPGKIQVALYDDRLEVTSPGSLDESLTLERLKSGLSKVRNKAIASLFSYMEIVETWGSGIPRIFEEIQRYGLIEPEIIDLDGDVRVVLYRKTIQTPNNTIQTNVKTIQTQDNTIQISNKSIDNLNLNNKYKKLLQTIENNKFISTQKIAEELGWSVPNVKYYIRILKKNKILNRVGTSHRGHWEINLD